MLTFYVESDVRQGQLRHSPVGPHVDGLTEWLRAAGYKRRPGQLVLRGAAHLAYWTSARGVPLDRLDDGVLKSFAGHLRTCACRHPFRGRDRYHRDGAHRVVAYLRDVGVVAPVTVEPETVLPLVTHFGQWMRHHRGVTASTVATYVPLVAEFLAACGTDATAFHAAGVRAFIVARASRHGRSRAKSTVNAIRMFLRFLAVSGHCSADLVAAVPRIAEWKLSSLPRYISAADVARVCAACDAATAVGARDRAILLLLARLGLRAGDVRGLCLTDIDWSRGRLRVMGKGRCETWLPLPQDVGDAVWHYLTQARPAFDDPHVFLRVYAPLGPLPSSGPVSALVRRALRRAAIDAPSTGAHVLRHSAATDWLRQGVSLDVIGAVLRHRCLESTAHYAKVDGPLLQMVAQPWPAEGGGSC